MAEYKARLLRIYRIPVISTVIYLRQKRKTKGGKKDTGLFEQKYPQRFLAEYDVIRLWEMDGGKALANCTVGNLPFIPLMEPPERCNREEWLSECVSVANEIIPKEHLPNLLFSMSVLSGLVIDDTDTIETIIPEEIMKESAFYQHIVKKARADGKAEGEYLGISEALFTLINTRFTSIPRTTSRKIKSIHDKKILLDIQKLAINAQTKKEFVDAFNASRNTL